MVGSGPPAGLYIGVFMRAPSIFWQKVNKNILSALFVHVFMAFIVLW